MRDLIDERNRREKIKSSIIKRYNVNYIDPEALRRQEEEKRRLEAQSILADLENEKNREEEQKREEIERMYAQMEDSMEDGYNAATGSRSGVYGRGRVDDVTKGQIDMILQEKDAALKNLIDKEKK